MFYERKRTSFEDVIEGIRSILIDARISELKEEVKPPKMSEKTWSDNLRREGYEIRSSFYGMDGVELLTLYIKELIKEGKNNETI